jgi:hypothetical protein
VKERGDFRIAFVIVYFGKWPAWFNGFLATCKSNPTIDWLIYTDCPIPVSPPANVIFISGTYNEFRELTFLKTGVKIPVTSPRKLCDLKPAYAHILENHLLNYTHWGFCDMDIFWGNISNYITSAMLINYDLITTLEHQIAGHFTVLKNNDFTRKLYQTDDLYKVAYANPTYQWFDERIFSSIVTQMSGTLKVCWDKSIICKGIESPSHQDYYLDRWLYDHGSIHSLSLKGEKEKEYMYLHFISWKSNMKCPSTFNENRFYISYNGIRNEPAGNWSHLANRMLRLVWGFPQRKAFNLWKRKFKKRLFLKFPTLQSFISLDRELR